MLKYKFSSDLDSAERTRQHREIILSKPFLKNLYREWYRVFTDAIPRLPEGKLIELGSGGGFLKEINPAIICTDVLELKTTDMTFSALEMPFSAEEISGIFMVDTFHHIPDAEKFLKEAYRVLKKGGEIIMTEPANSTWGRFIYKNFHHEPFETGGGWTIASSGPLSGANGALPWIVFERDRQLFSERFPGFTITETKYHTPFRYLLSGGVSFKQLVPGFSFSFFSGLEKLLTGLSKEISMFVTIKIVKSEE
jgi:SAM-dependent methyltransferase